MIDLDPTAFPPDDADGPCAPGLRAAAEALGTDMRTWIFGGGEDHALLATFPPGAALPGGWHRIGIVRPAEPADPADPADSGEPEADRQVLVGGERSAYVTGWSAFDR